MSEAYSIQCSVCRLGFSIVNILIPKKIKLGARLLIYFLLIKHYGGETFDNLETIL